MSRRARIFRNIAIGLAVFIAIVVLAGIQIVRTDWFRNYVRQKIITATRDATGGEVEVGSFSFAWSGLRAVVTGFVIRGNEPAGSPPFVRASRVEVRLRLFTSLKRILDVTYLGVDRPEVNIIGFADGRTNIPTPKQKAPSSDKTALENVVDLAVGRFELTSGLLTFNSQKRELNVRGNNLRAQLWYNMLKQGYHGQLSLEPLYVLSGRNTPVSFRVTLPVSIERDRVDLQNARISTPLSEILVNASLRNLRNPRTSAHINGHVALADLKNAGNLPLAVNARNVPSRIDLDANATISDQVIDVTGLRLGLGHSNIEASGKLKDPKGNGSLEFKAQLALGELGRLAKVTARPEGTVVLNARAKLDPGNNYEANGNLEARNLSVQQGTERIGNVSLFSSVHVDPHRLDLNGLRLAAFGGELAGNVSLVDFAQYKVDASLRHLDLRTAAQSLGRKNLPYDGVVSGPLAAGGNLKAPGTKGVTASARLSIAPGKRGIPVSGRLVAAYNGAADSVNVAKSWIALPHTRLDLDGSLGQRLNIALISRDLNDLLAAAPMSGQPPITLNGGEANFTGAVTGIMSAPRMEGHLAVTRFSVEKRRFDALSADLAASSSGAAIRNGSLNRGAMQAQFAAAVGLRNWKTTPNQPVSADASIQNGDLADIMVLAGRPSTGYSGALSVSAHVTGAIGNPRGSANLEVTNGAIEGEPFDRVQAQVSLAGQLVTIPAASIASGPARVSLTAEYQHPRDSFTTGRIHARLQSNEVDLARIQNLQKQRPNTGGMLRIDADVTGSLAGSEFLLASVSADASARGLRFDGQNYGDFNATARTSGQTVNYNVTSNFAGSNIRVNGNTRLTPGYPTSADASLGSLPVERVLAVAKRTGIPVKGNLSGTARYSGTMENPQGSVDLDLASAVLYEEPIDHVRARVTYLARSVEISRFEIVSGPSNINLSARYDHPAGNLRAGNLQFRVNSSRLELGRIRNLRKVRSGLGGTLQLSANGAAAVQEAEPRVLLRDLDANVAANGIAAQGKNFGDLTLTANTTGGRVNFALDSNLAGASIHGKGNARLGGDYPLDAQLTFSNITWTRVQSLLGPEAAEPPSFEATVDGQISANGPVMKTDDMRGALQLTRLQFRTIPATARAGKPIVIENQGPVTAALDRGAARIENLHLTGPKTSIQASGSASLKTRTLNVTLNASTDLGLLQSVNHNVYSSGSILLAATARGTTEKPLVNGRLELHDASVNYSEFPNGISNANGVVTFNGNTATVRNLTAESGGGKITLGGFAAYAEVLRFGLRAEAAGVRVRVQQGVSTVADADIRVTGTTQSSLVSGTVTINQVTYAPQSDFGSILSRAAPPVQAPAAPSPLLDNMKIDIRVRTSSSMAVQASLAQNLQADADLRIRGTASQPGILGRVAISEGKLVFFGSTYTVNTGTVSFYNPVRIEPVLNVSLETQAKGVKVVLTVTGPIDNMKLSYTSDPPLQFQEIVSLLAAGRTPASDPTILANQPSTPPQSFQQMGESALLSKAIADPVAGRLQRVFGVSQLKIDPTFTSGSELPQARLTLQQQISTNLTFTYVTALDNPNTQIVRIELALNPQWSAIANRDQNGIFSVNFFYKKQIR